MTAYSVVLKSSSNPRKDILDILARRQQEKSKPSAEEVKPQISEKARKEAREIKEKLYRRSSDSSDDSSTQPQTGTSSISEEEREKKLEEEREKKLAASRAAFANYKPEKKIQPKRPTIRSIFGFGGNKTKKSKKGMSLCAKKTAKKCEKVRGCKVASGTKRTYCRKKKNHSKKSHKK
jgi:hypothetical protein